MTASGATTGSYKNSRPYATHSVLIVMTCNPRARNDALRRSTPTQSRIFATRKNSVQILRLRHWKPSMPLRADHACSGPAGPKSRPPTRGAKIITTLINPHNYLIPEPNPSSPPPPRLAQTLDTRSTLLTDAAPHLKSLGEFFANIHKRASLSVFPRRPPR